MRLFADKVLPTVQRDASFNTPVSLSRTTGAKSADSVFAPA